MKPKILFLVWWESWKRYVFLFAFVYIAASWATTGSNGVDLPLPPVTILIVFLVFQLLWWLMLAYGLLLAKKGNRLSREEWTDSEW